MIYPNIYVAWDLETTGFDPVTCEIIEIGAMKVVDGEVVESRSWLLNHNIEIPEEIVGITGITKNMIDVAGRDPGECIEEFMNMLIVPGANLTHNGIRFDIPFLIGYLRKHAKKSEDVLSIYQSGLENNALDTSVIVKAKKLGVVQGEGESFLEFAKRVMDIKAYGVKHSLAVCIEEYEIPTEGHTHHRALADCHFTNELYKKLSV